MKMGFFFDRSIVMDNQQYIEIIKKKVKRFTLRVSIKDNKILCTVPIRASNKDIVAFIGHHQSWIEKQQSKVAALRALHIQEKPGTLLFMGDLYAVHFDTNAGFKGIIDKEDKIIMSTINLESAEQKKQWYKEQAQEIIPRIVKIYAERYNFVYGNIAIKSQKSKWGSCSSKGNLNFNTKIMRAPEYALHYLIIHELVHTKYFHHGAEFWQEIEHCYPEWKKAELYLKREGRLL